MDLPALLLHLYGVPIPEDFDGRVHDVFLSLAFRGENPIRYAADVDFETEESRDLSEDEIAKLEDHLRGLGYL